MGIYAPREQREPMQVSYLRIGRTLLASLVIVFAQGALAQEQGEPPAGGKPAQGAKPGQPPKKEPKKYEDVITAEAKTQEGLFKVHQIGDKVYFEIPKDKLDRDMMFSSEIAELPTGFGYLGAATGTKIVRWTRTKEKI